VITRRAAPGLAAAAERVPAAELQPA